MTGYVVDVGVVLRECVALGGGDAFGVGLQEAARGGVVVAGPHIDQAAGPLDGAARKAPLDAQVLGLYFSFL